MSTAMQALATEKFTLADIRNGKSIRAYAQSMIRHARSAEMTSEANQLIAIWNGLDLPIRIQIPMPTSTSLRKFLEEIDNKEPIFVEMANRREDQSRSRLNQRSTKNRVSSP
jgi:hypothetical protein